MKIVFFFLALMALSHLVSSSSEDNLDANWAKYKIDFDKKYGNSSEEYRRKEIFRLKLIEMEQHNAKYKQGLVAWYKGVNEFSDLTNQEFAALQGDREVKLP